ncbi:MAG: heme ABC transporter permease CcmC [Gammaproteobacteria bacterium]
MPRISAAIRRLHALLAPAHFYRFATRRAKWFGWAALILFIAGGYGGLVWAPPDYQMGDSYRIVYVHAPAAWMSMFVYLLMAAAAACGLIWHVKLGDAIARACAPLGAAFTLCALLTGALWGKPTWGAYWVWDARLTSELALLFLFAGYIALANAFEHRRAGARAAAVLALVGVVNLPVIHFSVEWWNTLHQSASVGKLGRPSMDARMLIPLLLMFAAFNAYFFSALLNRASCELLESERRAKWVAEAAGG